VDATRNAVERYPNATVGSAGYLQVTETPSKPGTGVPAAGCNKTMKNIFMSVYVHARTQ